MSPVRFLENTTLPAPIIATLITARSPPVRRRPVGNIDQVAAKAVGSRAARRVDHRREPAPHRRARASCGSRGAAAAFSRRRLQLPPLAILLADEPIRLRD